MAILNLLVGDSIDTAINSIDESSRISIGSCAGVIVAQQLKGFWRENLRRSVMCGILGRSKTASWPDLREDDAHHNLQSQRLPLAEFRQLTDRVVRISRDWVSGVLEDHSFLQHCDEVLAFNVIIAEMASDDDEYDWSALPEELREQCEFEADRHGNAIRLLKATRQALVDGQRLTMSGEDLLVRVSLLAHRLQQWRISPDLLVDRLRSDARSDGWSSPSP
ncbi:hypothetical protein [Rubinisphaera margarita]|uniref:hypothetical protein n=1 Tax=Rubinisphaera margarita TaxID=2909586 RepID=UPI001EE7BB10|nr:hypothetical protein [Rubinisphaera margarita]MCG6157625.1 hypothetical protein [Rubinisphaera margarita]